MRNRGCEIYLRELDHDEDLEDLKNKLFKIYNFMFNYSLFESFKPILNEFKIKYELDLSN